MVAKDLVHLEIWKDTRPTYSEPDTYLAPTRGY